MKDMSVYGVEKFKKEFSLDRIYFSLTAFGGKKIKEIA